MAKYISNRQQNLKIGIVSYTEDKTVLEVIGNVGIGTTNATSKLWVGGDGYFTGILTASRIFSSVYGEFTGGSITGTNIVGSALSVSGISTLGVTSATNLTSQQLNVSGNLGIGTTNATSKLWVNGDARITGILTIGTSSIVLDGANNKIYVGSGVTISATEISIGSNIIGSGGFSGNVSSATFATSSGIATSVIGGIASVTQLSVSGISTLGVTSATNLTSQQLNVSGITTVGFVTASNIYSSGVVTATTFYGTFAGNASSATYATNAGISTNIKGGAIGNIPYQSAADTTAFLINGDSGTILQSNGVGNLPTWVTPAAAAAGAITGLTIRDENNIVSGLNSVSALNFVGSIVSVASTAGIATITFLDYVSNAGIATFATSAGIATYATNAGVSTYATNAGVSTYSDNAGIATYATNAGIATALQNVRTFQITGDVVASPISFDGTGNVSLAATIQPNSVGLGTDTTGDYVRDITGTVNQISVSATSGEGSTPILSIPSQFTAPQDVTVTRDLLVSRNLNVDGNITIGGTSATLFTTELKIADPDIVLGFRTDGSGNDISNDNTANHGGVALASTEGTPLVQLFIAGIETAPATYKKIMWFKSGTFAGLGTDAWLINYAVGIGSTQFPTGTRLAAGNIQFTQNDLAVVRNINASGVVTATSGFAGNASSATFATNAGIATYATNSGVSTYATNAGIATFATNAGIATNLKGGVIGNIPYQSAADTTAFLTNGGSGTILQSNGVGNAPTWVTPAAADAITGLTIRDDGTIVGGANSVSTLNFVGSIVSVASTAGIATITFLDYVSNAGIATYATNAGIATFATNAGVSTYATNAGIATFATNAGISTNLKGGVIGNIPYQSAADTTAFLTNGGSGTILQSNGVGNAPTWVTPAAANAITGLTIRDENNIVSGLNSVSALNFVGSIVSVASTAGIATITFLDYVSNAGVSTYSDNAGIATYATNAGISTSVIGGIVSVTQLNVSGISTFTSGPVFIGAAISTGTALQRLQVTDGAYVSGSVGIGTTNPTSKLQVQGDVSVLGIITATQLSTGASGTGVNISTDTISGPSLLYIDPAAVGDNTGAVRIKGDLYVDGTQFIVNSTTIELADFNVGIATTVGTNALLDGAGIGIGSTGIRKTLTWNNNSTALKSSEDFDVASGKVYKINGTSVLSNNTLGSDIVTSSLTSVGTLTNLSVGNVYSSGIVTTLSLRGYSTLVGTASSTTTTFVVTVASKTSNHRYFGTGSGSAYFIDGIESPFLTLLPGKIYRFTQEDGTNSSHPILFYYQADKTTGYTTNVTTTGTPGYVGAYTEIVVTDTTPVVLHYQCSNHAYMGNAAYFSSNVVDTPYQITARSGINVTGVVTATSFVKTGGTSSQFLKADGSVDVNNYTTDVIGISYAISSNMFMP